MWMAGFRGGWEGAIKSLGEIASRPAWSFNLEHLEPLPHHFLVPQLSPLSISSCALSNSAVTKHLSSGFHIRRTYHNVFPGAFNAVESRFDTSRRQLLNRVYGPRVARNQNEEAHGRFRRRIRRWRRHTRPTKHETSLYNSISKPHASEQRVQG